MSRQKNADRAAGADGPARAGQAREGEARLRETIARHFDEDCEIRLLRYAPRFGSHVFVVDAPWRNDYLRYLGSTGANGAVLQQSAMSLTRPDRLVFQYERLMTLAFGLVPAPRSALLLGLGGGAMARFLASHLPACAVTIVENDETIIDIARRFFYVRQEVVACDAAAYLAEAGAHFDVVLVDLYDAGGAVHTGPQFWERCLAVLAPQGCIAVNWADFDGNAAYQAAAAALAGATAGTLFITPHGFRDNLVQFAWPDAGLAAEEVMPRLHRFERERHYPFRLRNLLRGCIVSADYPKRPPAEAESG